MFDSLTHALFGNNMVSGQLGIASSGNIAQQYTNAIVQKEQLAKSKKLFHGTVEVLQVSNGYIVNIGRKEGYEYETYIADTITDVNERIAAAIVAFQLENT